MTLTATETNSRPERQVRHEASLTPDARYRLLAAIVQTRVALATERAICSQFSTEPIGSKLALVNHFKRIAIWIKHVRGVIAGIIFQTSTRRDIVLCARSNRSLVEGVYRFIVFCDEALLAITKAPGTITLMNSALAKRWRILL